MSVERARLPGLDHPPVSWPVLAWIAILGFAFGDIATTLYGVQHTFIAEANPLILTLVGHDPLGFVVLKHVYLAFVAGCWICTRRGPAWLATTRAEAAVLGGHACIQAGVVAWNLHVLASMGVLA